MDNLISLVEKKNYTQAVKTIESTNDIFRGVSNAKRENLLQTLDFSTYTMVIQGLLEEGKPSPDIIFVFNRFLREFDYEQVRPRLKNFSELCRKTVNFFLESKIAIKIVRGLQIAIEKITAHDDGLTALHPLFLKTCIQTKTYKQAVPLLQKAVTCFNKHAEMSEEEITNYFYYGGHIMMALKQYEEAYLFFRFCIQMTHSYVYSSTLNAKKRLIILVLRNPKLQYSPSDKKFKVHDSLIGRYLEFARSMTADDSEVLNMFCKPYTDLLYEEKLVENREEFEKYVTENKELFEEDKTWGLITEISTSFFLRKLKELKKIYQNYPLTELANMLGVKENSIVELLLRVFEVKPIGRIDFQRKAVVFVKAKDPYRIASLQKLYSLTNSLKQVSQEYNKEHEAIIRDRISMPNTIFS